jgi:hypothetical protein
METINICRDSKNKQSITIKLNFSPEINKILFRSITKTYLIEGATISNDSLIFKTFSLKTFEEYKIERKNQLTTMDGQNMIASLTTQLQYLIQHENYSFLGYSEKNMFVLNDYTFIYLHGNILKRINDSQLSILSPFYYSDFYFSPEMNKIKTLPFNVDYRTVYFSIGLFILCQIKKKRELFADPLYNIYLNNLKTEETPLLFLDAYLSRHKTKLDYFLSRCLNINPLERKLLFI